MTKDTLVYIVNDIKSLVDTKSNTENLIQIDKDTLSDIHQRLHKYYMTYGLTKDLKSQRSFIEYEENWGDLISDIPSLNFKPEWDIKIIPPFGGAMGRFTVKYKDKIISVYYDVNDSLGYMGEPYWELYPTQGLPEDKDDFYPKRYLNNETEEMLEEIEKILTKGE